MSFCSLWGNSPHSDADERAAGPCLTIEIASHRTAYVGFPRPYQSLEGGTLVGAG